MASANDVPVCIDCYYKFEVACTLGFRLAAIGMNHASVEMDFMTGLHNFSPKIQVPEIPKGPMILNNIKIDNSVVGSVNTGTVHSIDVAVTYLDNGGNKQVSHALAQLTELIVNSSEMAAPEKNNMLDQVSYLSEQAASAAKDRKPGMIKAALGAITQASGAVTAIETAWTATKALLEGHFGF